MGGNADRAPSELGGEPPSLPCQNRSPRGLSVCEVVRRSLTTGNSHPFPGDSQVYVPCHQNSLDLQPPTHPRHHLPPSLPVTSTSNHLPTNPTLHPHEHPSAQRPSIYPPAHNQTTLPPTAALRTHMVEGSPMRKGLECQAKTPTLLLHPGSCGRIWSGRVAQSYPCFLKSNSSYEQDGLGGGV